MGKSQRIKGQIGEREWCKVINKILGIDYARTPASGGMDIKGDVHKQYRSKSSRMDDFHCEVKRQESINIHKYYKQAEQDSRDGKIPIVAFRRNNDKWKVCLDAQDFLSLVKELDDLSKI